MVEFNMLSKATYHEDYGTFCQMVAYKTNMNCCELGPDFIRLRRRYEIPNGEGEWTD